jgi:hypothetical protein
MAAALIPIVAGLLDKLIPDPQAAADAKLKAIELAQRGELAYLDADRQTAQAQIDVNKIEAAQDGIFKGGWRPAVGWVCVLGLAYHYLARPLLPWLIGLFDVSVPALPPIDIESLMVLLTGMLGLGGLRSWDKSKR